MLLNSNCGASLSYQFSSNKSHTFLFLKVQYENVVNLKSAKMRAIRYCKVCFNVNKILTTRSQYSIFVLQLLSKAFRFNNMTLKW